MARAGKSADVEKNRIMLGLLESVERGGEQSQRGLASELGVALGLVNAYLNRCVKKGLVKVRGAPARRYVYYLTPHGFSEKARLTLEYMSHSFSLFRRAKTDCVALLATARERGFLQIALMGESDLAEIMTICALDSGVSIVALIDPQSERTRFMGFPVVTSVDQLDGNVDAVIVTDISGAFDTVARAMMYFGADRVLVPDLLGGDSLKQQRGAA